MTCWVVPQQTPTYVHYLANSGKQITPMKKIDYKKELKYLYSATAKKVAFIDVPPLKYLMVHGKGEPGGPEFTAAIEALYPLAYTIKFHSKTHLDFDYVVPPLEGLWWADDMNDFINDNRDRWLWTLMIMQPDKITNAIFDEAIAQVKEKKHPAAIDKVEFCSYTEGKCAQVLHVGPFSEEGATVEKLHAAIESEGYSLAGKHHEIYLSDMRRVAPEKYRTIVRQPVA